MHDDELNQEGNNEELVRLEDIEIPTNLNTDVKDIDNNDAVSLQDKNTGDTEQNSGETKYAQHIDELAYTNDDFITKKTNPFDETKVSKTAEATDFPSTHTMVYYEYTSKQETLMQMNPKRMESDDFDIDTLSSIAINMSGGRNTEPDEITKPKDLTNYVNDMRTEELSLTHRQPRIRNIRKNGNVDREMMSLALSQAAGIGTPVMAPLWNSGFWVALNPPKYSELVNLYLEIGKNEIEVGRETVSFVYSNQNVINTKIIMEFIERHIKASSLALPDGDSILEYIKYSDYQPLITKLLESIYPDGHTIIQSCVNSFNTDEKGIPLCKFSHRVNIEFDKVIFYNRQRITPHMISIMSNTKPGSVTVEDIKSYQNELKIPMKEIVLTTNSGSTLTCYIKQPTIYEMINEGVIWVEHIKKLLAELGPLTGAAKEDKIDELYNLSVMNTYKAFINNIRIDYNGIKDDITDRDLIEEAFDTLSGNDNIVYDFISKIREFIREDSISIVGIPTYTCPSCNAIQTDKEEGSYDLDDIITLNMPSIFFDLCILRMKNIKGRITG